MHELRLRPRDAKTPSSSFTTARNEISRLYGVRCNAYCIMRAYVYDINSYVCAQKPEAIRLSTGVFPSADLKVRDFVRRPRDSAVRPGRAAGGGGRFR